MWTWQVTAADRAAGEVVQLTNQERGMLACMHKAGNVGLTYGEISTSITESAVSLGRFGLIEPKKPREIRSACEVFVLSKTGLQRFAAIHLPPGNNEVCCEHMVLLPCVCWFKTYCPTHGGGCHGSHD